MGHEKSITVKRGKRFFNVDTVGGNAGATLGNKKGFATAAAAVKAAKKRSRNFKPPVFKGKKGVRSR